MDISWLTDETAVLVTKATETVKKFHPELRDADYVAEKLNTDETIRIGYDADGRMTFNGVYVYTEDFMAIVGMLDAVEESPQLSVVFKGEASYWD